MNGANLLPQSRLEKRLSGPRDVSELRQLRGIFGGGGFFGSGAKTTVANTTTNVNQEDYSGTVAREGSVLQITQREESPEAIEAARQIGLGGLDLGALSVGAVAQGSREALNFATNITDKTVTQLDRFGDRAFSTVEQALGKASGAFETAASYQDRALDTSLDFVGNILDVNQKTLGNQVAALNAIATENNKSADQRVAEISGNAIKYTTYAVIAIGLGLGVWAFTRGRT